jgi:uncharacterized protein (TIGR02246 family)
MDREALQTWLENYGRAWEGRDADAVAQLFAENATYQERPFTAPFRGRAAIREYWQQAVVRYQERIRFGFEIVAFVEDLAVARWWASFTRLSSGKRVNLDGIFLLRFAAGNLCRELREWWHRQDEDSA